MKTVCMAVGSAGLRVRDRTKPGDIATPGHFTDRLVQTLRTEASTSPVPQAERQRLYGAAASLGNLMTYIPTAPLSKP